MPLRRTQSVCASWRAVLLKSKVWSAWDFSPHSARLRQDDIKRFVEVRLFEPTGAPQRPVTRLRSISLRGCALVGADAGCADETIRIIARHCPFLTSLDVSNIPRLTQHGLGALRGCLRLSRLRASGCNGVRDLEPLLPMASLTELDVSGCGGLDFARRGHASRLLEGCPRLTELSIAGTGALMGVQTESSGKTIEIFNRLVADIGAPDIKACGTGERVQPHRTCLRVDAVGVCVAGNGASARPAAPPPLTVVCGMCGRQLFPRLESYVIGPGSQAHLAMELYASVEMEGKRFAASSMFRWRASLPRRRGSVGVTMFNCVQNCHGVRWLVDSGSAFIQLLGARIAVAVGPGLAECVAAVGQGPARPGSPLVWPLRLARASAERKRREVLGGTGADGDEPPDSRWARLALYEAETAALRRKYHGHREEKE